MSRSDAHAARNEALRTALGSVAATKEASLPTKDVVAAECQRLGVALKVEDVADSKGARIHWIGETSPQDVILYFHGTEPKALLAVLPFRLLVMPAKAAVRRGIWPTPVPRSRHFLGADTAEAGRRGENIRRCFPRIQSVNTDDLYDWTHSSRFDTSV